MMAKNLLANRTLTCYIQSRCMARGRNYYLKGASKKTGISPEARDLLVNMRHAENVDEWKREPGIGEPKRFVQYRENADDIDDEKDLDMTYFPHKGEEPWPENYEPSPVLIVKRIATLKEQPWFVFLNNVYIAKTLNLTLFLATLSTEPKVSCFPGQNSA